MVKIYTLTDPVTGEVRYIGKTKGNLVNRWYSHCSNYKLSKEKSYKNSWIISLKQRSYKPIIEILDEVPENDWEFWEMYWIIQFKNWGFNLTNMTKGGEGGNGGKGCLGYKHTEEAKRSISIKNSRPKSLEWVQNATNAMKKTVAKPILQYTKENELIKEFESFYEAANYINIEGNRKSTIKNIHACCNNKRKSAYNFIWKYKESVELGDKEPLG